MYELNKKPLALRKMDLLPEEEAMIFDENFYKELIQRNRQDVEKILQERSSEIDGEFLSFLHQNTRMNGAINLKTILSAPDRTDFFDSPNRKSRSGEYSRGYSYVVALDSGLTATEKIVIYKKDLRDGVRCFSESSSRLERFLLTDYIKNSLTTMLNALLSQEKVGLYDLENREYQAARTELCELVNIATQLHYQYFFNAEDQEFPKDFLDRSEYALAYVEQKAGRRYARLHTAALSRPEASHPLVIFYSSLNIDSAHPDIDTIIGLPSGGTEIALATAFQHELRTGISPETILLPISLHSIKNIYGEDHHFENDAEKFLQEHRKQLRDKDILVCDDNSSTGKTLQKTYELLDEFGKPHQIFVVVAEIDITRSLLDRKNPKREYVANPELFNHSVNILPVSSIIKPKVDIKELMDTQEVMNYHRRMIEEAPNVFEKIYHEIMLDVVEYPTADSLKDAQDGLVIDDFHGTFLSNFYAMPIMYKGSEYPSVEHAYQRQKFSEEMLANLDGSIIQEIEEKMRSRGYAQKIYDLNALFTDATFTSGNIKVLADILRKHGIGKEHWAEERVRVMIELSLIKYSNEHMKELLQGTEDKLLVEGNTWGDTLWGFCEGQGTNLLGRLLMNIRKNLSVI